MFNKKYASKGLYSETACGKRRKEILIPFFQVNCGECLILVTVLETLSHVTEYPLIGAKDPFVSMEIDISLESSICLNRR